MTEQKASPVITAAELASSSAGIRFAAGNPDAEIRSVEYDSRKVMPGSLFVAVEGFSSDGHSFAAGAVERGASAVLVSEKRKDEFVFLSEKGAAVLTAEDTRRTLGAAAAQLYGHPSDKMKVFGITGTNGKTSVTYMMEAVLKEAGIPAGVIGTVNVRWPGHCVPSVNTTPESSDIQKNLYDMEQAGVKYVIMEVSSHALALNRAADVSFDGVAFTNLTGDHLDFHRDMETYFQAKMMLFDLLEKSSKKNRFAAVNMDDEYGRRIASWKDRYSFRTEGFGIHENAMFRADEKSVDNRITGISFSLMSPFPGEKISMHCAGGFQLYNTLTALSLLAADGIPFHVIKAGLEKLEGVPGRFQSFLSSSGISAVVDYAHTGDAVDKLLSSVCAMKTGRIITVFGCGGDRDKTKRPVMGKIASEKSDTAVITSDNPRTEEPEAIIADILKGIDKKNFIVVPERRQAIRKAAALAVPGDIIVLAGKGHEDYQIIGKTKVHFDDMEEIKKALEEVGK